MKNSVLPVIMDAGPTRDHQERRLIVYYGQDGEIVRVQKIDSLPNRSNSNALQLPDVPALPIRVQVYNELLAKHGDN